MFRWSALCLHKEKTMSHPRLPRPVATASHPSNRGGSVRRPFGDPIAFAQASPRFIAPPFTNRVNLDLPLEAVMPVDWIQQAKQIVFHTVGDTGGVNGREAQDAVSERMEAQVEAAADTAKPAFLYHLGDVVYFNGQSS